MLSQRQPCTPITNKGSLYGWFRYSIMMLSAAMVSQCENQKSSCRFPMSQFAVLSYDLVLKGILHSCFPRLNPFCASTRSWMTLLGSEPCAMRGQSAHPVTPEYQGKMMKPRTQQIYSILMLQAFICKLQERCFCLD